MNRGFTLIEVLIATVVLFFAITTLSSLIQSGILTKQQVNHRIELLNQVPLIIDNIKLDLVVAQDKQEKSGTGWLLNGQYRWNATIAQTGRATGSVDGETGEARTGELEFLLWQVDLVVSSGSWQKSYRFEQLGWIK